jgi:protein phosphatase
MSDTPPLQKERVITIPPLCMVVLIGASGSGKSTFAARHFLPTEILSSDAYRAVVSDDATAQNATGAAFDVLHYVAAWRLKLGKLVVIDATNVKPQDRAGFVKLAREHDVQVFAVVLHLDERICIDRNAQRPDRTFGAQVVRNHVANLRRNLRNLEKEGFGQVTILRTPAEVDAARFERVPLSNDRRADDGPFDIIGDVHGCYDELLALLQSLGYQSDDISGMRHPEGRRPIFLGDLVDRGPKIVATVDLARRMVAAGQALCVPGNHDVKLARYLAGHDVQITHGLEASIAQIEAMPEADRAAWSQHYRTFITSLPAHYVLHQGKLVVAHAGMKEAYQGRASGRVAAFALFGETTGETDEFGLPLRENWAADYRGQAAVVYGHTAVEEPTWLNNTIDIDTGCVYGGKLTALRWPERTLLSVPAQQMYAAPKRPLAATAVGTDRTLPDTLLRLEDVQGKQIIATRLMGNIIIEADRAAAALEVMSRFAVDPRWLIYLPPTMSPSETTQVEGYLEYPDQALGYYRQHGVTSVICEEKHMGSRAVLVLCRDGATATRRFGVPTDGPPGVCYTRTGRRFFEDAARNDELITRLTEALTQAGVWARYETDWLCLDAEILPWNLKAQGLLRDQYAPVGAAGMASLTAALRATEEALQRGLEVAELHARLHQQQDDLARYMTAYRRYCWDWDGLHGVRIAPFHLLATEGKTYLDRDHPWHMAELARLAAVDPLFLATDYRAVDLTDDAASAAASAWWQERTDQGAEGMVVKPRAFIARQGRRLLQPAIKCRGREYLRIIYGPDYTLPAHLNRLRTRNLTTKRNVALREFALGAEALERFVGHEPLWRVHQPIFGVLALESEPIDPRL